MKRIITLLIAVAIVLISLVFSSCTPQQKAQRHLRKAQRHITKARIIDPSSVKTDTIFKEIPVAIPVVKVDTLFKYSTDTLIVEKDRIKIKYFNLNDTVYIEGECKADTIIKKVPVEVKEQVFIRESFWQTTAGKISIIVLLLIAGFMVVIAYLRIFTP